MRVLLVHNRYQQPGGEDRVFEAEAALLRANGVEVHLHEVHNDDVEEMSRLSLAAKTLWNREAAEEISGIVRGNKAEVVHFHNTLPLISPAAIRAARQAGAATVLTLHNFRLICPGALLLRDDQLCETCIGKRLALPGIRHGCYRGDRAATAAVAATTALHHAAGTWSRHVDRFVALTASGRSLFIRGGLPADRIAVKPNFCRDAPEVGTGGEGPLFVGRLSSEKGIATLIEAWRRLPEIPLTIIGDGPLAPLVRAAAKEMPHLNWLGGRSNEEVRAQMQRADLLIFPSIYYEGMPVTMLEAMAAGLPIVASNLGAPAELVSEGETGFLFPPGDANSLADTVRTTLARSEDRPEMRRAARRRFDKRYTSAANFLLLMTIYREAIAARQDAVAAPPQRITAAS